MGRLKMQDRKMTDRITMGNMHCRTGKSENDGRTLHAAVVKIKKAMDN